MKKNYRSRGPFNPDEAAIQSEHDGFHPDKSGRTDTAKLIVRTKFHRSVLLTSRGYLSR
jgi:hypothetical protein